MVREFTYIIFLSILLCLPLLADSSSSTNYNLQTDITSSGGGYSKSTNYNLNTIIGDIQGQSSSNNYNIQTGFYNGNVNSFVQFSSDNIQNCTINSVNNITNQHAFLVNSSCQITDPYHNIQNITFSSTFGVCNQVSNSTSGNSFFVIENCSTVTPGTTKINITMISYMGKSNNTTTLNISYPNWGASLTIPTITPTNPDGTQNLTCNPGTFISLSGDSENTSNRSWQWYLNGTSLPLQINQTLANSNFNISDNISCSENTSSQYWYSNASNMSTNVTIQILSPSGSGGSSGPGYGPQNKTLQANGIMLFGSILNVDFLMQKTQFGFSYGIALLVLFLFATTTIYQREAIMRFINKKEENSIYKFFVENRFTIIVALLFVVAIILYLILSSTPVYFIPQDKILVAANETSYTNQTNTTILNMTINSTNTNLNSSNISII